MFKRIAVCSMVLGFALVWGARSQMQEEQTLPLPVPPATGLPATPDHSAGLIDPAVALAAAKACTAEKYPDADDAQIDSYGIVYYAPNGAQVQWSDNYIKILTEKGRRDNQAWPMGFNANYGGLQVLKAEIYHADGSVEKVNLAKHVQVQVDSSQMSSNIYDPAQRDLTLSLPHVEIGDVVHVLIRHWEHKVGVPDTFSDYTVFESNSPILHETYEVHAPAARPLKRIALKGELAGTVTYTESKGTDGTVHRWEARNVPRYFPEPDMPAPYTCVQRLLVSTAPDWNTISKWYWGLCEPRLNSVTPAMKEEVAKLTKDCRNDREKVEALFSFVSQQIRYMGITTETEAPGYEPHNVSMTFDNRYGVCRDKAALLVAMLRLAKIEGFPVLINAGPKKDPEVPMPAFNHAIVAARLNGEYILMDPTDETTRELLPAYLSGKSFLVATPEGDPLRTSAVPPATSNLATIRTEATLDARGRLAARTTFNFDGINDNAYRSHFAKLKPEERRRVFEGLAKRISVSARVTAFKLEPEDMQNRNVPVRAEMSFEADSTPIAGNGVVMPPRLWFSDSIGVVHSVIESAGLEKRRFPLQTGFPCGVRESFTLDASAALAAPIALPTFANVDAPGLRWQRTIASTNGMLTGSSEFLIRQDEYDPAAYLALKQNLRDIETDRRKTPVFRPAVGATLTESSPPATAPAPAVNDRTDAEFLEMTSTYDLQADGSCVAETLARKRILTYAGVKQNAELKLAFNPVWEQVELVDGRVTMASGEVRPVTPKETNVMDAPWNASAPRYPGAKIMVISLPGVEIGSVVEFRVRQVMKARPFLSIEETFGGFEPVARKTVRITAPAALALALQTSDPAGLPVKETKNGDRVVREWTQEKITAARREGGLPPARILFPTITASTGSWAAYGKTVAAAFDRAAAPAPEIAAAAKSAVGGAKEAEALRALRDFVARQIRDAGPSFAELPLDRLTPAATTLRDGYGHNADRMILLAALIRAAGMTCDWLLVSGDPDFAPVNKDPVAVPEYGYFSEPVLRVVIGKTPVLVDAGDQYARLGTTALEGKLALDCAAGCPTRISVPSDLEDRGEMVYAIDLDAQGAAKITRKLFHRGAAFGGAKRFYAELPPEERRRHQQELVSAISQNAVALGDLQTDFDAYPGSETLSVQVARYAVRDGAYLYFELPDQPDNLLRLGADRRSNPLYRGDQQRFTVRYEITLPKGFSMLMAPSPETWDAGTTGQVVFTTGTETRDGRTVLKLERTIGLNPYILPAADYAKWLIINSRLSHPRNGTILLEETK